MRTQGVNMNNWWNKQYPATKVLYMAGGAYTVGWIATFAKAFRSEYKKRKKIEQWETMNRSAIRASMGRLVQMAEDPDTTAADLWIAMEEEEQFLRIIQNQPMY
jgi:hypothetical protein